MDLVPLPETQAPWPAHDALRITGVRAIVTAPEGVPLVVVRVDTSDAGLFGLGCATFTQRFDTVVAAVGQLAPLVVGRHPADIEDITRMVHFSSYWRAGPVLNNALSGLDQALWDIAGKRAGVPVYELLGGRLRAAVPLYIHAAGATVGEALEQAEGFVAAGFRNVRLQLGQRGAGRYGSPQVPGRHERTPFPGGWDVQEYLAHAPELFAAAREALGPQIGLMHDAHSRLTPKEAIVLARALEPYRLFFLEDPVAPEYYDRLPEVRAAAPVPVAVGELLSAVPDAVRLVAAGGVDLLRLHVSAIGGLTPARKLANLCELLGARIALHSPADVSPIGWAANLTVSATTPAFAVQEGHEYADPVHEVFPGTPRIVDGHAAPSDRPGWGIDLDERLAGTYPPERLRHERWAAQVRRPDGGIEAP